MLMKCSRTAVMSLFTDEDRGSERLKDLLKSQHWEAVELAC